MTVKENKNTITLSINFIILFESLLYKCVCVSFRETSHNDESSVCMKGSNANKWNLYNAYSHICKMIMFTDPLYALMSIMVKFMYSDLDYISEEIKANMFEEKIFMLSTNFQML